MEKRYQGKWNWLCSLTTAGLWKGMPLQWNKSDRQNKKILLDFVCVKKITILYSVVEEIKKKMQSGGHFLQLWRDTSVEGKNLSSSNRKAYAVK